MNLCNLLNSYSEKLHPARFKCLTEMIKGIVASSSVQVSKIARSFNSSAQPESVHTQIYRFLENEDLSNVEVARWTAKILALSRISSWTLVIDRTNWKYGKKHNNLLVLGVLFKNVFVPLISDNLGDTRKSGNSSMGDRMTILDTFKEAFPDQHIKEIIGDREFVGDDWLDYLNDKSISYVLRLKENWSVIYDEDNKITR